MKKSILFLCLIGTSSHAALVSLTPGTISGGVATTLTFTDGNITLSGFIGSVATAFNNNPTRLGIPGTNANAFNDPDTNPNNGNEQKLQFAFNSTSGLTMFMWDFSRADGPGADSGVSITGFSADPGASFSGNVAGISSTYSAGILRFNIPGATFADADGIITFSNPGASSGQTLLLKVTDEDQAGAQLAITGIQYDNAVPEPSSLLLPALAGLALAVRRRR